MQGWNNDQKYLLSILKRSFDMQHIISSPRDTVFVWNGLIGQKTIYTKDSLLMFFIRPADTITRPCILMTHGNNAKYRSSWNETLNFYVNDLVMRGFCVAYYENPSSFEAKEISVHISSNFNQLLAHPRNAFYNGFQSAVAADIFVKHFSNSLNVDTTKIFAGGFSFGAYCSLMLATADAGKNFTDSIFSMQGNYNAKSLYNNVYTKNINRVFAIGGGLPKDDTVSLHNSKMGKFINRDDSNLSILFFHGRTDNFVSFDLTKISETDTSTDYFFGEGPRALMNNIMHDDLTTKTKLFVNCTSGHSFLTQVCGYSNPYCLPQFQWLYMPEPPADLSSSNSYFQTKLTDTLLHYFSYMMTQVSEVGYVIGDFIQPAISNTASIFQNGTFYIQPRDSFTYAAPIGYYILRNTDCEGHAIIITKVKENISGSENLKVYPNPAGNFITVEANEMIERINIYTMVGGLIKEIYTDKNLQQQVDLSMLPSGNYICTVQLKEKLITQKITVIKQ
ncbi:MAG: putative protein of unknown function acetylesterase [Bacteroidota bacterium]|nr:putative protein of unknown function acetylesterase [Bacteroidota bacterium]